MTRRLVVTAVLLTVLVVLGAFAYSRYVDQRPLYPFALVEGETVASWRFAGAYSQNPELRQRAQDEIARLQTLFGKGEYTDYTLYISVANQYDLLGEGEQEVSYLRSALAKDATSTGLAWYNLGQLLDRLDAPRTARMALQKAAEIQPIPEYTTALQDFLKRRYPGEQAGGK